MPRKYHEKQIADEFVEYYHNAFNPETFYRRTGIFNKSGVSFEGRPYTEIYSELILKYSILDRLADIKCICIKNSYNPPTHAIHTVNKGTNQKEKTCAKGLLKKEFEEFGRVIGFEIPLRNDRKGGNIDLLSYNKKTNSAYVLELKKPGSKETLLRCAIEAYTYSKRVHHYKLRNDYNLPDDCSIIPAALVFEGSIAANEYFDIKHRPFLDELLKRMNVKTFVIRVNDIPAEYLELSK